MADTERFGTQDWLRLIAGIGWLVVFVITPRLTFAVTLMVIGGGFVAFNAMVFWMSMVRKGHAPAVAPIFGGLICGAGVAILPVEGAWTWAWIPLFLDWGGLPLFIYGFARRIKTGKW